MQKSMYHSAPLIIKLFYYLLLLIQVLRCTATLHILLWHVLYIVMHKIYNNIHGPCLTEGSVRFFGITTYSQSMKQFPNFRYHWLLLIYIVILFILNSQLKGLNFEVCRPLYAISWMFNWSLSSFGNVGFHMDSFTIAKRRF